MNVHHAPTLAPSVCVATVRPSRGFARWLAYDDQLRRLVVITPAAGAPGLAVRSNPAILRRLGTEPAFRDHFLSRVESNGVSMRIEITLKRTLPAAERKERHRRRHADIDAEHPD